MLNVHCCWIAVGMSIALGACGSAAGENRTTDKLAGGEKTSTGALEDDGSASGDTMRIASHRNPCVGVGPRVCMVERQGDEEVFVYDAIEGFTAELGHEYKLSVEHIQVVDPPADGSSVRTKLKEVLEDKVVDPGTRFTVSIYSSQFLDPEYTQDGESDIVGVPTYDCDANDLCDVLDEAVTDMKAGSIGAFELELEYGNTPSDPRRVVAVGPTADE